MEEITNGINANNIKGHKMLKSYAIRARRLNGVNGFQIVYMFVGNYFHRNGFKADEYDVKKAWFKTEKEAQEKASFLQYIQEQ